MKKISFVLAITFGLFLTSCSSSKTSDTPAERTDEITAATPTTENQNDQTQIKRDMENLTKVLIKTSEGDITIALYDNTPKHKENFIKLVNDGFYNGVLFHRIIQGFMIQTGDPESKGAPAGKMLGNGGPGYTIPAEFKPENYHKRGAVAAARQGDQVNPTKASSGSQFYIVDGKPFNSNLMAQISYQYGKSFTEEQRKVYETIGGAPFLDGDYTVFGEVVEGMDVVDKIAAKPKDRYDRPTTDVKILSTEILK
ncbi:MAG: peptidylprolyl isomerase [Bacteroidales bacterium]|nr:peptidylprolyl isomerase [Bacteroidales bacterium]